MTTAINYTDGLTKTKNNKGNAGPLKSMGSPGSGLFSFDADIALVTAFLNFTGPEKALWKNGNFNEMLKELDSLLQDASLDLALKLAVLNITALLDEEMQGLIVAMFILEFAGVAMAICSTVITKFWISPASLAWL